MTKVFRHPEVRAEARNAGRTRNREPEEDGPGAICEPALRAGASG